MVELNPGKKQCMHNQPVICRWINPNHIEKHEERERERKRKLEEKFSKSYTRIIKKLWR